MFDDTSALPAVGLLSIANNAILVTGACLGVAIYRQFVAPVTPGDRSIP
ncbi:hypothetical protein [Sphingomonas bacterium]|nr:hypothetical protein [Sphingomonas bacterium]